MSESDEAPSEEIVPPKSFLVGNARFDEMASVPLAIYNPGYISKGVDEEEIATNFITNNKSLLQIEDQSDDEVFSVRTVRKTGVWRTVRYYQMYKNIPVYGSEVSVTFNDENKIRMVTSTYKKGIKLKEVIPKLSSKDIKQKSASKYGNDQEINLKYHKSQLVIYQKAKGESRLAWKVNVSSKGDIREFELLVDDKSGDVILEKDKTLDKQGRRDNRARNQTNKKSFISHNLRRDERRVQSFSPFSLFIEALTGLLTSIIDFIQQVFNLDTTPDSSLSPSMQPSSTQLSEPSSIPSHLPSFISSTPSIFPSAQLPTPSPTKSMEPTQFNSRGIGYIFDPDPLSTSGKSYCDTGFCDNNDNDSDELNNERVQVSLRDITFLNGEYVLKGPYAQIHDFDSPLKGEFAQSSNDFRFTREEKEFEAVNTYYHLDNYLRYVNEDLGIDAMPIQYDGGVKFDPHAANGDDNSYYSGFNGALAFGEGGIDDAEDADVIIHELGHGIHDWVTDGALSNQEGLSEGFGDYLAVSYARSKNLIASNESEYNWVFKWDGHNQYWGGRSTDYDKTYPNGLVSSIHTSGQIWATCSMKIWDFLGREKSDKAQIIGISALGSSSNQQDAAEALFLAVHDLGFSTEEINAVRDILRNCGYNLDSGSCGDGILGNSEECDGDLIDASCESIGCNSGIPICDSECKIDYSKCSAGASQFSFQLDLQFDSYPEETNWNLADSSGSTLFSSSNYIGLAGKSVTETYCLAEEECYGFTLFDEFGDGICCEFGSGSYNIYIDSAPLNNENPQFSNSISHSFGICET